MWNLAEWCAAVVGAILLISVMNNLDELTQISRMELNAAVSVAGHIIVDACFWLSLGLVLVAMVDVPLQRHQLNKKLKMTRQEVKDEMKDMEGQPEVKAKIREFQLDRQAEDAERTGSTGAGLAGGVGVSGGASRANLAAEPATRFLVRPYDDWSMAEASAMALSRIGEASVPALRDALRSSEAGVRVRAADTLAKIGPGAGEAVPELISALNDPDMKVRKSAARALGQIGPKAAPAVPTLMKSLSE